MTNSVVIDPGERRIALVGIFLCIFLAALDQTIVSTALPRIVQDLGGTSLYAWVATSYLLASTVALPISGRLADVVAPKYILVVAAALFLVGSALSGQAHTMDQLIIFRGVQGLGGGAIFAVAASVIGMMFPPRERGRVQGMFGAVFGLASVVGPYLGGLLTDAFSWRYVFYVNMPFGALALYVLIFHMPLLRPARSHRFDTVGVITLVLWTVPLLLALSWAGTTYAWTSPEVLGLLALAVAALVAFYVLERRSTEPLFPMSLLKVPTFVWSGLGTLFFGAAFLGSVLFLPFYLVMAKNITPLDAGLVMTPLTAGVVVGSMASGILSSRIGRVKSLLVVGNIIAIAAFVAIYHILSTTLSLSELIVFMVILGIGIGPGFPLYTLAVQNVVRMDQMGTATSGNQFFRQIGSAIGAALMGVILVSTLTTQIPAHLPASLRGSTATVNVNSDSLSDQTQTRRQIEGEFGRLAAQVALALKGNGAAYADLMKNPRLPPAYRRELVPGGIPAEIVAQDGRMLATLGRALHGSAAAQKALQSDPAVPAAIKRLGRTPPPTAALRQATLIAVKRETYAALPRITRAAEQTAIRQSRAAILRAGAVTARDVNRAVAIGITAAVRNVFLLAGALAAAALVLGWFIPNIELRRAHGDDEVSPAISLTEI